MPAGRRHNAGMQRITAHQSYALHDTAATRRIEPPRPRPLPEHTLMQRGRPRHGAPALALALAPHARRIWIACGGGNNGGDGLEAAMLLHRAGHPVVVTWLGTPAALPADARQSWQRALDAGVHFAGEPPELGAQDLCVDALLGIGLSAQARAHARPIHACCSGWPRCRPAPRRRCAWICPRA